MTEYDWSPVSTYPTDAVRTVGEALSRARREGPGRGGRRDVAFPAPSARLFPFRRTLPGAMLAPKRKDLSMIQRTLTLPELGLIAGTRVRWAPASACCSPTGSTTTSVARPAGRCSPSAPSPPSPSPPTSCSAAKRRPHRGSVRSPQTGRSGRRLQSHRTCNGESGQDIPRAAYKQAAGGATKERSPGWSGSEGVGRDGVGSDG